jgi:hypothetical protein
LNALLGWLLSLPALAALAEPVWQGAVLQVTFTLSLGLLASILLAVLHAGWTTSLILQVTSHRGKRQAGETRAQYYLSLMLPATSRHRVELLAPLTNPGHWFGRTLAVLAAGTLGLLAVAGALISAGGTSGFVLFLLAILALAWNLLTAGWLLGALRSRGSFFEALGEGLRASRQGAGRWWGVVVLHLILMGWVTFLHVSYSSSAGGRFSSQTKTDWGVNAFWTGGYEGGCRWYAQLARTTEAPQLLPVATLLGLLFGAVAVAVKLTVAQRMGAPRAEFEEDVFTQPEPRQTSRAAKAALAGRPSWACSCCAGECSSTSRLRESWRSGSCASRCSRRSRRSWRRCSPSARMGGSWRIG